MHDDGGFGLDHRYDPFGYKEPNPAATTYTMTVCGHVGRVLLSAYRARLVERHIVQRMVALVMELPRVAERHGEGACVGYSTRAKDARECVTNVNQWAGWFLDVAREHGMTAPGSERLIADITRRQASGYRADYGSWPYIEGRPAANDFNHAAASAEAALRLSPAVGRHAGATLMNRRDYERWVDPMAQLRLAACPPLATDSLLPVAEYLLDDPRQEPRVLTQFALWTARLSGRHALEGT